jgi:hypothetical protein
MSVISTVSTGLHGALLLARGRPDGVRCVDSDRIAATRSFWAIPLCLPSVVCLKLLDWLATGGPAQAPLELCRYIMAFLVGWLLFVWISHYIASMLHREAQWPRFIAIWAYCSVIENTLVAIGSLPGPLGAPSIIDQAAGLAMTGWALWLEWYAIRLSLQVGPLIALVVVIVDFSLGVITMVIGTLLG